MKKLFIVSSLLMLISLSSFSLFAQFRSVPGVVTDALKEKYPEASNVSWKDKISVFVASFEFNSEKIEARFTEKGEWRSTEKEIQKDALPQNVKDGWEKSKYADWELSSIFSIELPDDVMQYRLQVSKNDIQKKNLLFNSDGKLLRDNITL
jgi:hypothetical protein